MSFGDVRTPKTHWEDRACYRTHSLPAKDRIELAMARQTPQRASRESRQRHPLGRGAPEARERGVTRRLVFRPEAEAELLDARSWSVEATFTAILQNPLVYPRVTGDTRRAFVRRFPYAVYFRPIASLSLTAGSSGPPSVSDRIIVVEG
jgi:hypothetical protein